RQGIIIIGGHPADLHPAVAAAASGSGSSRFDVGFNPGTLAGGGSLEGSGVSGFLLPIANLARSGGGQSCLIRSLLRWRGGWRSLASRRRVMVASLPLEGSQISCLRSRTRGEDDQCTRVAASTRCRNKPFRFAASPRELLRASSFASAAQPT